MSAALSPPQKRPPQALSVTPVFPDEGRLPSSPRAVAHNLSRRQALAKQAWHTAQAEAAQAGDAPVPLPCAKTLNISLYFDGTNNHDASDSIASPSTSTNVARLYHATFDCHTHMLASETGCYRYYMQGVGTEFKEIHEFEPRDFLGLTAAAGGENRINWGLIRLLDALGHACDGTNLKNEDAYALVQQMATSTLAAPFSDGSAQRRQALQAPLQALEQQLAARHEAKSGAQLLGLQLYVYGFSRGAAEARTFANWLATLSRVEGPGGTHYLFAGLPISIVFMGLFDTVASVGMAHLMPFAAGHMGWADDSQRLPDSPLFLRQCVHLVAAHEQRGCFPLDSIRRKANPQDPHCASTYRQGTQEFLYPGVHSDVGGGYPAGDQGKARGGGQQLLSQIALQHMYAEAFAAGAPLQVPLEALNPEQLKEQPWLAMEGETHNEFAISAELIQRFNAWQQKSGKGSLEVAMAHEAQALTGWRIDRFANGTQSQQPYYGHVAGNNNKDMTEDERDACAALHKRQLEDEAARLQGQAPTPRSDSQMATDKANQQIKAGYEQRTGARTPGTFNTHKAFEPVLDQRQLSNAAADFRRDYVPEWGFTEGEDGFSWGSLPNALLGGLVYMTNEEDEAEEYASLRAAGILQNQQLFSRVGVARNAQTQLLINLFDDQVHDSRAWFMNAKLNERELFSDYFRYRTVFFDDESNKRLSLLASAERVIGVGIALASIGLSIKRRDPRYLIGLALPSLGTPVLRGKVGMPVISAFDSATGVALPMLDGMDALRAFSQDTGSIAQQAKALPLPQALTAQSANTPELQKVLQAADAAKAVQAAKQNQDYSGLLEQALSIADDKPAAAGSTPDWLAQAKGALAGVSG